MKTSLPFVVAALLGGILPGSAEETVIAPGTARLLEELPDGTAVPEVPKPDFVVPAEDVLESKTLQHEGRQITVQRIRPIPLVEPKTPSSFAELQKLPAVQERAEEIRQEHPQDVFIQAGATVYRPADSPPVSFVQVWPQGGGEPVTFWSSADFGYLSGFSSFAGVDGKTYSLLLMWSVSEARSRDEVLKEAGDETPAPPKFAAGAARFSIVSAGAVPEETRAAIQALHDLYNAEHDKLKAACEGRERVRLQQEAAAKANPPENRPITMSYWRTERPAAAPTGANTSSVKGGAR